MFVAGNDITCITSFVQSFEASLTMYFNPIAFELTLWRVEGNFVVVGIRKDFGQVWQIAFKTTTCGKVGIQLACGTKGVSHGEACAWLEGA
jgi:hypothetical protein